MQKILSLIAIAVFISACSSGGSDKNALPGKPASVKAVQDEIKGKKYKAEKVGMHSLISSDTDVHWMEPKKENDFEKKIVDEFPPGRSCVKGFPNLSRSCPEEGPL